MARNIVILCLAAAFGSVLSQTTMTKEDETAVNLFAENDVQKLFNHYDKDHSGKLSPAEQDKFLDGLQKAYAVELPAEFRQKAKASHDYTMQEFQQTFSAMTSEFNKVQTDTIVSQTKAIVEEMKKEQEVVNLISTNNVDKLFAHYDKQGDGKLTPAEQDDFLNDLQKVSAVDLPASFVKKAKRENGMDIQEFKQIYSSMRQEFETMQTEALKNEMKETLKEEFTQMLTAYDKDGDGKLSPEEQDKFLDDLQNEYNIDLPEEFQRPAREPSDEQEDAQSQEDTQDAEDLMAYEDDQPSWMSNDIATFFIAAITSAAFTTIGFHVYRKVRKAPAMQDDYLILSA